MLRAKIWTFSNNVLDSAPKYRYFGDFRRAALDSFEGRKLAVADLGPYISLFTGK
jgi:hypothetical protein